MLKLLYPYDSGWGQETGFLAISLLPHQDLTKKVSKNKKGRG